MGCEQVVTCLVSIPARAHSYWDIPGSTEAYGAHLPREPRGLGSDGAAEVLMNGEGLGHPLVSLRVERQGAAAMTGSPQAMERCGLQRMDPCWELWPGSGS